MFVSCFVGHPLHSFSTFSGVQRQKLLPDALPSDHEATICHSQNMTSSVLYKKNTGHDKFARKTASNTSR
ncbi:hypothetical protein VNO77_21670 [Canavalia gladiata]|uniref:Uncharacterized protein n=1 Tax=Canavalia gladiata TaxID=3824 RepID=A0AAN9LRW9_CANGL